MRMPMPTTLPNVTLTEAERKEQYGIPFKHLPAATKKELKRFKVWATLATNLLRSREYANAVQSTSINKTLEVIRAYLGFVARKFGVAPARLSLIQFADAIKMATFLAYLKVRVRSDACMQSLCCPCKPMQAYSM